MAYIRDRQKNTQLTHEGLLGIVISSGFRHLTRELSSKISLPSSKQPGRKNNPALDLGIKPSRRISNGPGRLDSHTTGIETKQRDNNYFFGCHSLHFAPMRKIYRNFTG
jgi:hypothetical protein